MPNEQDLTENRRSTTGRQEPPFDRQPAAGRTDALAERRATAARMTLGPVPADSAVAQQAVGAYFAELIRRFPDGFEVEEQTAHDAERLAPPTGFFLVAIQGDEPAACGGVQTIGAGIGEIKRMWVDPGWRGAGLGSRLLRRLEQGAVELGHRRIRLDTNDTLTEAIAMYRRAGYREIERYNDNPYARLWLEKIIQPR